MSCLIGLADTGITVTVGGVPLDGNYITGNSMDGYVVKLPNNAGIELPSTGGMGTEQYYLFGSLLILGAAAILFSRRRSGQA